jgi:lysyl-tRNA synthetase class 2
MSHQELSEQEIQRRESLNKLRSLNIEPFPAPLYPVNSLSSELLKNYEEGKEVCLAGRMMSRRIMGKASFAELQDSEGRIQIYVNRDEICPEEDKSLYNDVFKKLLDLGDFIGIKGTMFKTQVGEISISIKELTLLSKSIRPLPLPKTDADGKVYDALTDPETRSTRKRNFCKTFKNNLLHAFIFEQQRIPRSRNPNFTIYPWRRCCKTFCYTPQRTRYSIIPQNR